MKTDFCAFLSASTDLKDKRIVEWFSDLLIEYKITPLFAVHIPEPRPPQEKIRNMIEKSDMTVAILTRRDKIEGRNLWTSPEWVQDEISIAFTLNKPIAIFVEEGVRIDRSISPFITECVRFRRGSLSAVQDKAKRFIRALRTEVKHIRENSDEDKKIAIEDIVKNTIVEDVDESLLGRTIIRVARKIILGRYGKLNVSLRIFYVASLVVGVILSYLIYDFIYGTKFIGNLGAAISIVIGILLVSTVYIALNTRCKHCESYFSEIQKPVTYSDALKFPELPKSRKLLKFVCEVCKNVTYDTEERS